MYDSFFDAREKLILININKKNTKVCLCFFFYIKSERYSSDFIRGTTNKDSPTTNKFFGKKNDST